LSQPSQAILAPLDNAKNKNNNKCELDIEVPKEVCSCIDQTSMKIMKQNKILNQISLSE